ncbi:berberine bridge enzyme-like 4 [Prosopis cineraria]|uniref:berberine bridge enzyme-like 4 n=1 Tax=Prosopis cineraria TaxID=364024 RepID=UPI00240FE9B4|nr:berberine bridge enzyme-like 4 [Prosopis cineraria]
MKLPSLPIAILAILLFVVHSSSDSLSLENFLQCFANHISQSSTPLSTVIFTPSNSSFASLLLNRTSNRRYTTPTTPKPLAIVAAQNPSHVQVTVICAKSHDLQIRIRSGGHDYEGLSYVSQVPFIVLDMFNLHSVQVDKRKETALVQAGATMGELYYNIAKESNVHAFPAGVCVTLGAGGHISGGGYGNLMRKYGLSIDNIIDAELVDVNGRILNRKTMGEDLFWAIRGGGAASFGVVLSWKIKLVSVPSQVTVFRVKKTLEEGVTDLVYKWQLVASDLDNDLFIRVMPLVINGTQEGKKTIRVSFIGQFLGNIDRLISLMNKSFPELGLKESDCIGMPWVNSTLFWADYPIGTSIDELLVNHKQPTQFFKSKSDYVKQPIPKTAIESIWKWMIDGENMWMQWNPYGGKMREISSSETPFPHRAGILFLIQYYTHWEKQGYEETNHYMNFSRSFHEFMAPYVSKYPREAFLNYRDFDIGVNPGNGTSIDIADSSYGRKYFKDNLERLVHVKTVVDPDNFFKHEQSIPTNLL